MDDLYYCHEHGRVWRVKQYENGVVCAYCRHAVIAIRMNDKPRLGALTQDEILAETEDAHDAA